MGTSGRGLLPADLGRGRHRFQTWREQRQVGERIPQPLWTLAVRLAKAHGHSRTAAALGLDYYSLKKQVEATGSPPRSNGPAFVELPPSPFMAAKHCRIEIDNGVGATLRIELTGYDVADVEALARSVWDAR